MTETINQPKRTAGRLQDVSHFFATNYLNVLSACLLLAAMFYFVQVQKLRNVTLSNHPELFSDREIVTVIRVIDGDEVRIRNASGSTLVRILGIQSFDPSERNLLLVEYGRVAVDFLESELVGNEVKIVLTEKRVDNEGRLLATLMMGKNHEQDVAKSMISRGLTLVFTKFPFPQIEEYLECQDEAKAKPVGLWQNQRVRVHADSLMELWNRERSDR